MSKSPEHSEFKGQLGDLNLTPPSKSWEGVVGAMPNSAGEFASIGDVNISPPPHIWSNISAVLAPNRKRRLVYWWFTGAAAAIFIGMFFTVDFNSNNLEYSSSGWTIYPPKSKDIEDINSNKGNLISEDLDLLIGDETTLKNQFENLEKNTTTKGENADQSFNNTGSSNNDKLTSSKKNSKSIKDKSNVIKVIKKDHFNTLIIAFFEPKTSFIPSLINEVQLGRDSAFVPPPMPKRKVVSETILAANFGATGKSSNAIPNVSGISSFAAADVIEQSSVPGYNLATVYNVSTEVIDYSQKLPITFGVNVRKTLGRNLFLSSGLLYAGTTGIISYSVNAEDHILKIRDHYIGIPISAGLNFFDRRRFHLFSSISHLNEALLVRTEINSYPEISKSSTFSLNPQLGIGASFGLLFKLKNSWGVSASVSGKSYYIAPQNSYWKSQRVWPSINVSVVYNFHKKELFL